MRYAFVLANDGSPLMPTSRAKARKFIREGKAVIAKYRPFTIILTYKSKHCVQQTELCMDTGSEHIGVSVKSEAHEYVHAQYDNLSNEKQKHEDRAKYRRARRNRLRYRKPNFDNNKIEEGWFAPTVEHKKDNHIRVFEMYAAVCPISDSTIEVGQFDTAAMQAEEIDGTILQAEDYQKGLKYQLENLREAIFVRDGYTCQCCGKSVKDGVILHVHHIGFWKGDHSDRSTNLLTVCHRCHTAKNHKPGGKLYGLDPVTEPLKDATFMNIVRWRIINELKEYHPNINIQHTYGSYTKASRRELNFLPKTHANDAYAMGMFHPKHRAREEHYVKHRRNNRVLSKFYDAVYIDSRDGTKKKGSEIGCNRTNRKFPRNNPQNERIYRGPKISKGRVSVRRQRYSYQPGDVVLYQNKQYTVVGTHCKGASVILENNKSISVKKLTSVRKRGGWVISSHG